MYIENNLNFFFFYYYYYWVNTLATNIQQQPLEKEKQDWLSELFAYVNHVVFHW